MTDLALNTENDLLVVNGQLSLLTTQESFIRQRIMISLNTFTKTWFENQNFGINQELIFEKGTQSLLDQDIRTIVTETSGVQKILDFTSTVSPARRYTCDFTYITDTGEIVVNKNISIGGEGVITTVGIWTNGYWDYLGVWDDEEVWGSED